MTSESDFKIYSLIGRAASEKESSVDCLPPMVLWSVPTLIPRAEDKEQTVPFSSRPDARGRRFGGRRYHTVALDAFPATQFTFTCWLNCAGSGPLAYVGTPDQGTSFDSTTTTFAIRLNGPNVEVDTRTDQLTVPSVALIDTEAHHIAVTFSQPTGSATAQVAVYVDAVQLSTKAMSMQPEGSPVRALQTNNPMFLGAEMPSPGQDDPNIPRDLYPGQFTDVHLYSHALTQPEVAVDAVTTATGAEPGLYLALPFDTPHIDPGSDAAIDIGPGRRHAQSTVMPGTDAVFGYIANFHGFPTGDRTLQFWTRMGGGGGRMFNYADLNSSDHPNDGGTPWSITSSDTGIGDGMWHHVSIVVVLSPPSIATYLDGVLKSTSSRDLSGTLDGQPLLVGARQVTNADGETFTGVFGDIRLWKGARDPALLLSDADRGAAQPPDTDPNLVAHWSFTADGGGGDLTGHGHDLSMSGRTHLLADGSLSEGGTPKAMVLAAAGDGMGIAPVSIGVGDFAVEAWVSATSAGPVVEGVDAVSNQRRMAVTIDTTGVAHLAFKGVNGADLAVAATGSSLLGGEWRHVAVTRLAGLATLYIDGNAAATLTAPTDLGTPPTDGVDPLPSNGTAWRLGSLATPGDASLLTGAPTQLTGSITEVRLWGRALVVGEVRGGMHHSLRGDEPGLLGRWGFEHGLGRDSSAVRRHATIAPAVTFSRDVPDLELRDTPYLVSQSKLVEDYVFTLDPQKPGRTVPAQRTSYRVVLHAFDVGGNAMADLPLTIGLQPDPAPDAPGTATLSYATASGTTDTSIGAGGATVTLSTNRLGNLSVSMPATGLIAPVLRVTAPFMAEGHALLVFPDRHAHDFLSKVTGGELLGQVGGDPTRGTRPALIGTAHTASAEGVASAIRQFMSVSQERDVQSQNPVLRDVGDRLISPLTPVSIRRYENVYVSPAPYLRTSDVTAGHALLNSRSVTRQVVPEAMPSWQLTTNAAGALIYSELDSTGIDALLARLSPRPIGRLASLLLPTTKRDAPLTSAALNAALNDADLHERGIFDFFQAIADAVTVVVHAVSVAVQDIAKAAVAVIVTVVDAVGNAVAAVVNTVYHAAQAVAGVLHKVGVAVEQVVEFVKDLFHWGDVLDTQKVVKAQIMRVLPFVTTNLSSAKNMVLGQIAGAKTSVHTALEAVRQDALKASLASGESTGAYGQPKDMRASYVQNMLSDHAGSAVIDVTTPTGAPAATLLDTLSNSARQSPAFGRVNQRSTALSATTSTSADSMSTVLAALIPLVEEISDDLFDLSSLAVGAVFDALDLMLTDIDAMLKAHIQIPLITDLYERVITNGEELSCYSLAALIGALPLTVIYKLAKGTSAGPFPGGTFAAPAYPWPYNPDGSLQTRTLRDAPDPPESYVVTTWVFGGAFVGNMLINGVLAEVVRYKASNAAPALERASLAFSWIFQLSQFPLDALRRIAYLDKIASATIEQLIWWFQFLPVALDTYLSFRPHAEAGVAKKFRSIYMSFFGLLHMISFVALYSVEKNNDRLAQVDSGLKFMGNMVSCVPEADAFLKTPWAVLADAISLGLWETSSAIRLGLQIDADRRFLMR